MCRPFKEMKIVVQDGGGFEVGEVGRRSGKKHRTSTIDLGAEPTTKSTFRMFTV
jgi:hypothetical protein